MRHRLRRPHASHYHLRVAQASHWVEIGDRVYVRRYPFYDQNIGVVLGRREALVIDTRSTYAQAREILADLRELTDDPVEVVVDTHGHFDHAFGNAIFRPATIWGHERCVTFMVRTGEARKRAIAADEPTVADELAEIVIDPPDRTFATHAAIEVGGREVMLRFLGRGHTDHDIIVDVPGTDVIFAGDLVENGNVPFFGDAYPLEWPTTAAALAVRVPEGSGVVVPGHGDHGGRAFADAQAASLTRLADLAQEVASGAMPLDDAVAAQPFPDHPAEDARRGFERALQQIRGELDAVASGT
jgi:glyoxylase-like metal-dependent hydrolase (beta-lactamase superfamily II)